MMITMVLLSGEERFDMSKQDTVRLRLELGHKKPCGVDAYEFIPVIVRHNELYSTSSYIEFTLKIKTELHKQLDEAINWLASCQEKLNV